MAVSVRQAGALAAHAPWDRRMPPQEACEIPKRMSEPVPDLLAIGADDASHHEMAATHPNPSRGRLDPQLLQGLCFEGRAETLKPKGLPVVVAQDLAIVTRDDPAPAHLPCR